ncbi:DUF1648 domain-containing protein [Kurthia sp. FSL E2-0154]|uniref:DUF1648 domain-containing protein n=1 Tax=Kurthia sp. FSL E2-0154 TaxID=2921358 RepID=UPI004046D197
MLLIIFFNRLPAEVPSHYNILGEPDCYANHWFVFFIPHSVSLFGVSYVIWNKNHNSCTFQNPINGSHQKNSI